MCLSFRVCNRLLCRSPDSGCQSPPQKERCLAGLDQALHICPHLAMSSSAVADRRSLCASKPTESETNSSYVTA